MHTSQRGAAHINIFYFLVMLVLFIGAAGFGYINYEEANRQTSAKAVAQAERTKLEGELFMYRHLVQDISEVIGEAGIYEGRSGFDYSEYGNPAPIENVTVPASVRTMVQGYATKISVPETYPIAQFLGRVESSVGALNGKLATLESDRTNLNNQIAALNKSATDSNSARQAEVSGLNTQITASRGQYDSDLGQKDDLIASQGNSYNTLRAEFSDHKEQAAADALALRQEMNTLQAHNSYMSGKLALINPPQEPDGRVIDSSSATSLAWIDRGRVDMLQPGTVFTISNPGSEEIKARGKVVKIDQQRAEIQIMDLANKYDPVVAGDIIRNDLYSPNHRRTIYLMGRFSVPHSKKEVAARLASYGNKVVDQIGPEVDLVIVGDNPVNEENSGLTPIEETEEYKEAQRFSIEFATVSKMRHFLSTN
ncbi:MAG: hypothetical protein ACYTG5_06490 [Planctomycetota bacterium]|jgi:hypothetical protein